MNEELRRLKFQKEIDELCRKALKEQELILCKEIEYLKSEKCQKESCDRPGKVILVGPNDSLKLFCSECAVEYQSKKDSERLF